MNLLPRSTGGPTTFARFTAERYRLSLPVQSTDSTPASLLVSFFPELHRFSLPRWNPATTGTEPLLPPTKATSPGIISCISRKLTCLQNRVAPLLIVHFRSPSPAHRQRWTWILCLSAALLKMCMIRSGDQARGFLPKWLALRTGSRETGGCFSLNRVFMTPSHTKISCFWLAWKNQLGYWLWEVRCRGASSCPSSTWFWPKGRKTTSDTALCKSAGDMQRFESVICASRTRYGSVLLDYDAIFSEVRLATTFQDTTWFVQMRSFQAFESHIC